MDQILHSDSEWSYKINGTKIMLSELKVDVKKLIKLIDLSQVFFSCSLVLYRLNGIKIKCSKWEDGSMP